MAIFSLADMSGAMSTIYRELVPQVQRKCPTIRLLSQIGRLKQNFTGSMMRWDIRTSGQAAAAVNADGGAFVTAVADTRLPAELAFGSYSAPIQVTDGMRWLGQPNAGIPADINPFSQVINQNIAEAIETLLKLLETDIYAGDGTGNTLLGLGSIIAATGIYANINGAAVTDWRSTVQGNAGVLRSLTLAMIKTMTRTVGTASAAGRPDLCFCRPALFDAVENLFDANSRVNWTATGGLSMPSGQTEKISSNPPTINLMGGQIRADGFRVLHWQSQNLWFIEAPDCTDPTATNPNNTMFFLNSADIEAAYPQPPAGEDRFQTPDQVVQAAEQSLGPIANLPFLLSPRGRTKHAYEWDILAYLGIKLKTRNAAGKLADVQ